MKGLASISVVLICLCVAACVKSMAPQALQCEGADDVPNVGLLLLGEVHGSVQAPEVTGSILCSYAKRGPVALGLEIYAAEQPAIDEYLQSDGSDAARNKFLAGQFWKVSKDGRSSMAMASLMEYARALKEQGASIRVFAFDAQTSVEQDRNAALANAI